MVAPLGIAWGESDVVDSEKLDPVSAWIWDRGRPFSKYLASAREEPEDFGYVAAIDAAELREGAEGGGNVELDPGTSLVAVASDTVIERVRNPSANRTFVAAKLDMEDPRVMLVPLRMRCINPAVHSGHTVVRGRNPDGRADVFPRRRPAEAPRAVIGIVDHAINFAHPEFRAEDGTRVEYAWVQDADWGGRTDLPFGREYTRREIDAATEATGGDEELLLRQLGLVDFSRPDLQAVSLRASHGTHVLSLLAGLRREYPRAPSVDESSQALSDVPIVSVTLPRIVTRETAGSLLGVFFLQSLEYILDRAKDLSAGLAPRGPGSARLPAEGPAVFVNFSFGLTGGPRRGQHILERAMKRLVRRYENETGGSVTIALPAGNGAQERGHATSRLGPSVPSFDVVWLLQPGDPTSNYLDIWIAAPEGQPLGSALTLALTPPGATAAIRQVFDVDSDPYTASRFLMRGDDEIGRASLRREGPDLLNLSIALAPTDPGATNRQPAPPGEWGVWIGEISATAGLEIDVNAWILRDDVVPGFPDAGRQSRFVEPSYERWTETGFPRAEDPVPPASRVRRAGTLNALATDATVDKVSGSRRLAVGGRVGFASSAPDENGTVAPYSGQPLPGDAILAGTDAAHVEHITHEAMTDRSPSAPGVLGAGTRGGARVAINGTSVAAPQALRTVMLEALGLNAGEESPPSP